MTLTVTKPTCLLPARPNFSRNRFVNGHGSSPKLLLPTHPWRNIVCPNLPPPPFPPFRVLPDWTIFRVRPIIPRQTDDVITSKGVSLPRNDFLTSSRSFTGDRTRRGCIPTNTCRRFFTFIVCFYRVYWIKLKRECIRMLL